MAMDAHYLVDASDAGCRLDAYLGSQDGMPSRSACARLIEGGSVALNGETVLSKKESVQAGDRISVELPDEPEPELLQANPFLWISAMRTIISSSFQNSAA